MGDLGMEIGIIADTHDNLDMIARAVEVFNRNGVGLVLHAGDFVAPFTARRFRELRCRLVGVFGNNDGEKFGLRENFKGFGEIHEGFHQREEAGRRIILVHQPDVVRALARSGEYDLVVYGHTHRVDIRKEGALIVNPGECGGWLTGRSTVAVLDLDTMEVRVIDLGP